MRSVFYINPSTSSNLPLQLCSFVLFAPNADAQFALLHLSTEISKPLNCVLTRSLTRVSVWMKRTAVHLFNNNSNSKKKLSFRMSQSQLRKTI